MRSFVGPGCHLSRRAETFQHSASIRVCVVGSLIFGMVFQGSRLNARFCSRP